MSRRRRPRPLELVDYQPGHGERWGRYAGVLRCDLCLLSYPLDTWMPTFATETGGTAYMGAGCACGGEASGTVVLEELRDPL